MGRNFFVNSRIPGPYRTTRHRTFLNLYDTGAFSELDAKLLRELEEEHGAPAEMIMKLLEVELSMHGLSRRKGLLDKLYNVLQLDWEPIETVSEERSKAEQRSTYRIKIDQLNGKYSELNA